MRAGLLDLLLPPRCLVCAAPGAEPLCPSCRVAVEALRLAPGRGDALAPGLRAVGLYAYAGPVAAALRAVKLSGHHHATGALGAELRAALVPAGVPITWVPTAPGRCRARGFDIPAALAGPDAVPLLRRITDGPDQTSLPGRTRRRGPVGAFAACAPSPARLVLIDDVRTTGGTARAAAAALQTAGTRRVLLVTWAVGGDRARSVAASTAPRVP